MTREEALQHRQAYLDRQLDASLSAQVEECLKQNPDLAAQFDRDRDFNHLVKRCSTRLNAPQKFEQNLRARLAAAQSVAPAPSPVPSPSVLRPPFWRKWTVMAAAVALVITAGMVVHLTRSRECPYMVSCAHEHKMVAMGQYKVEKESQDRAVLGEFIAAAVKSEVAHVPAAEEFNLRPSGAGKVQFSDLKKYGAPDGAFVNYASEKGNVTLLIHPWAEEEPSAMNKQQYRGGTYWAARHDGTSVATWKDDERKLVISVVSERKYDEVMEIAAKMRASLD